MPSKRKKDSRIGDELREWLPKVKGKMSLDEKKKQLTSLDQWVDKFDDKSWMKLAQQNKTLWQISKTTKEFSDMSWKVAINGAFSTLSGATKRQTYVATLQEPTLRLNLWCITLGYSGISRKTTTRKSIFEHLEPIEYLNYIPVKMTPEALYEELRKTPNAFILGDELGSFFKSLKRDYMSEMSDTLSDVYDCKRTMERSTVSGGRVIAKDPYLRIYGGGTMSIIRNLTDELFEQGFLPRFHFVLDFDLEDRDFKLIGKPNPHLVKEYAKVSDVLQKIGELKVKGLLYEDIPQEFIDYQHYCKDRLFAHTKRGDYITAPYYARLPFHALKLAGLLYLADLVLEDGTNYEMNVLPSEYIILGTLFMRLYEQEYLQLIYRYKSSAPSGRFDTQRKKLSHLENLLKLHGGIVSRTTMLKESGLESRFFDPIMSTLIENGTFKQNKITKDLLVNLKILKNKKESYPFLGMPPTLVWHKDTFKDGQLQAIKYWIKSSKEKKKQEKKK